ncbi:thiamine kinase-like enzyme [Breznakia sp. PF5-3]|uniref:phosphotransferase n=1 Tax=unclassified Breznakia TaxID=2623764 RepID=UPI002404CB81|nr:MULTISPECIES: phosphotransferase [unclassified Breznakia]MDF9824724.1 thiamine kinase-like enzyme [Breznakia sp. PM6-1]MDF9835387.1 thiamine kinase-like enzyme [Breznakia sp. PF5-3]MDF9836986.1 thiamine kinase-like enzyme [Breznakia sp. PFB2-8]MDF9859622.1 thiamine kinase-like enzyme [Breznakia sp. PH5-24]
MINKIIKHIFQSDNYTLEKLDKGITNHNYLLQVNNMKYVVRIPYGDSTHDFNRQHEAIILKDVRDLDVPTIYFDTNTGIKITEYIDHLYEYAQCPYEDKIERCARLIKKLHEKPAPPFEFNPLKTLMNYKSKVKDPLFDLAPYEYILEEVKHLKHKQVLCHNDIVSGNILFGEHRDYLIDYEYAASNDALFDVMSFISENQITDSTLRERFYQVYFDEFDDTIRHTLSLWEAFHNILWCYWAMMLYESRKESIYKDIANDKYNALKKMKLEF